MEKTQALVCNAFMEKKLKGKKEGLLSFFSPEIKKQFTDLIYSSPDLALGFNQTEHLLQWTHSSWFTPFLRTLPEQEVGLFLAAFSEKTAKELCKALLFSGPLPTLCPLSKNFLQKEIIKALLANKAELEPIEALPSSPLTTLLTISREKLGLLIEFLGLHDLATPYRQIIDTTKLKKIQACLSKEKLFFLLSLTQKKQQLLFQPLKLEHWNEKPQDLLDLLAKRGMNRLAKALYSSNPSFIQYIQYRMSQEKADLLTSLLTPLEQPKVSEILANQILEILDFFQKNSIEASS